MANISTASVWLDNLPEDVSNRIIKFLHLLDCIERLDTDAPNLSQVSDKLARQVLHSMENKFFLEDIRSMTFVAAGSWCSAAFPHLRHLYLPAEEERLDILPRMFLIKSPNLQSLYARADPSILHAIAYNRMLRVLDLSASIGSTSLANHIPLLFGTLLTLDLTALHLDCMIFHPDVANGDAEEQDFSDYMDTCGFEQLLQHDSNPGALGRRCPSVKTVGVRCFHKFEKFPLAAFLDGFRNLTEFNDFYLPLCIIGGRKLPDALVAKLKTLDSVHLNYVMGGCARVGEIGAAVKTLRCSPCHRQKISEAEDLAGLSKCENLETLLLFLKPGAETTFPHVARNLSLRTLCITWEVQCHYRVRVHNSGIRRAVRVAKGYHSPSADTLLQAIQASPRLCSLSLFYVRIRGEEVRKMLREMGKRLKSLALSIRGQEETPRERLTLIIEEIMRSNSELTSFHLGDVDEVWCNQRGTQVRMDRCGPSGTGGVAYMRKVFGLTRRMVPFVNWGNFAEDVLLCYNIRLEAAFTVGRGT